MKGVTDKDDAANFKGNLRSWQFENSVLFSVVRMIVLRQKTRHLKLQKNLKVSNFFKAMPSATSITNILRAGKNWNRSSLSRFLSVQSFSAYITYLQLQDRKLQSEVSPSRSFALEPHAKEPYYQHGKQNYKEKRWFTTGAMRKTTPAVTPG